MAQKKISQLTAAEALAGTEVFAVVQGGATDGGSIEQIREYVASQPNVFTATQRIESAAPALQFSENDTVDQNWEFICVAGTWRLDELNDAFSTTGTHHTFTHGGGTQFGSPTGGDQGAGTVNAVELYQDGESVLNESTSGVVIQQAFASTGAVISTTNSIPYDDTIPQITEGDEALSVAFTPKRSDSRIRISANLQIRSNTIDTARIAAIFRGGVSDALSASAVIGDNDSGSPGADSVKLSADVPSPGTSSQTFSARFGHQGIAVTVYLNGNSAGNRVFGGASSSTLEIVEYMP